MEKRVVCFGLVIITSILFLNNVIGQDQITDYKAKLLYNTTRWVEWPEEYKTQKFIIGVFGNTRLATHLETLVKSRPAGLHNIAVQEIKSLTEINNLHVLFIASGKCTSKNLQAIISSLKNKNILIVTEKNGLTNKGSAINFVLKDGILKFELKESNATKYGLKISSRLRQLAIIR